MIPRDDFIRIVTKLSTGGGDTEQENNAMLKWLIEKLPESDIYDLIFNDDVIFGKFMNLTPEQTVDEALRRQAEHDRKAAES